MYNNAEGAQAFRFLDLSSLESQETLEIFEARTASLSKKTSFRNSFAERTNMNEFGRLYALRGPACRFLQVYVYRQQCNSGQTD